MILNVIFIKKFIFVKDRKGKKNVFGTYKY